MGFKLAWALLEILEAQAWASSYIHSKFSYILEGLCPGSAWSQAEMFHPKLSQKAASKVTDLNNRSTPALTPHQHAVAAVAAGAGASSRSLSTGMSTSNSCFVSPGK